MQDTPIENCFLILGISPDATEEEVKEARNFATKAFHPDKYTAGSREQERAHLRQIEINDAYARIREWQQTRRNIAPDSLAPPERKPAREGYSRNKYATAQFAKILLTVFLAADWLRIGCNLLQPSSKVEMVDLLVGLLATLALAWIFLAPEAKNLIDSWVNLEE